MEMIFIGISKEKLEQQRRDKWDRTHKIINGVDHKICNKCNEFYPANEDNFYSNKLNGIDGLYPYCIVCAINKASIWVDENRTRHNENKNKSRARNTDNHHEYNKEFIRHHDPDYYLEWNRQNPDKRSKYNNKRSLKNHKITPTEWVECKKYFNYECAYCGKSHSEQLEQNKEDFHREHVDDQGANDLSNCAPSCTNCNSQKWTHTLENWYNEGNIIYSKIRKEKIIKWLQNDYKLYISERTQ